MLVEAEDADRDKAKVTGFELKYVTVSESMSREIM